MGSLLNWFRRSGTRASPMNPLGVDCADRRRVGRRGLTPSPPNVPPLDQAPHAYEIFQKKQDGAVKVILKP